MQDNGERCAGIPPAGITPVYINMLNPNHLCGTDWYVGQFEVRDGPNGYSMLVPLVPNPQIATEVAAVYRWENGALVYTGGG